MCIRDRYEGGSITLTYEVMQELQAMGVTTICLLALNDEGAPSYDRQVAQVLSNMDIPAFACTPDRFPDLMSAAIKKEDLSKF